MKRSPRVELAEKAKASALKRCKMAEETLLKARNSGEGPVFTDSQILNLSGWSKQYGADPVEFVAAFWRNPGREVGEKIPGSAG